MSVAETPQASPVGDVTELILAEQSFLYNLARRLGCRRAADIEDLVQDTLLRAYRARDRFAVGTSMRAWLKTIMHRRHMTKVLTNKRRATCSDTDLGEPLSRRVAPSPREVFADSQGDHAAFLAQVDERLMRAIRGVSPTIRVPFLLFVVEGLSYQEIAVRLGIPRGTVMSRIHRARHVLQSVLRPSTCGLVAKSYYKPAQTGGLHSGRCES